MANKEQQGHRGPPSGSGQQHQQKDAGSAQKGSGQTHNNDRNANHQSKSR